ncbi:hypothetical protein [Actinoplanes subtropicus]|uniref:hypothetical protein n=1 Tax=Actinoplanes subtropicus TaxID=543632 RepID=UPI00147051A3
MLKPRSWTNVTVEVALRYKRASRVAIEALAGLFLRYLRELGAPDAFRLVATALLVSGAAWPYSTEPLASATLRDVRCPPVRLEPVCGSTPRRSCRRSRTACRRPRGTRCHSRCPRAC